MTNQEICYNLLNEMRKTFKSCDPKPKQLTRQLNKIIFNESETFTIPTDTQHSNVFYGKWVYAKIVGEWNNYNGNTLIDENLNIVNK
ncbi:MAG: hypothetical protein ACRC4M_04295 [Mycoplasma sp.]